MSARLSHHSRRSPIQITITLMILVLTCLGIFHSVQASRSYAIYYDTKYRHTPYESESKQTDKRLLSTDDVLARCERAFALNSYNYEMCQFAAEAAFHNRAQGYFPLLEQSRVWSDRGLRLNPYHRSLNLRRAGIFEKYADYEAAIETMRRYTDWHFWHPHNHARLAELYAMNGELENADKEMKWAKHSKYYAYSASVVERLRTHHRLNP